MFIVHWCNWGPRVSGMYESVKNQCKYERREGYRSELAISYEEVPKEIRNDKGFVPISWAEAEKADIWVLHYSFPDKLKPLSKEKVTVGVLHGPTEHMLLKDFAKGSFDGMNLHINLLWSLDATVCLNTHEYDVMKLYDEKGERCRFIPNSIDLEELADITPWEYDGRPAILSCDTVRIEKIPTHIIWSMPYIVKELPSARLNLLGLPLENIQMWRNVMVRSHERKLENLCENMGISNNSLSAFQAGADIGFNNNYSGIASRVTMEMQAYGTPVISYNGEYTPYHAKPFDLHSIAEQVIRVWHDLNAEHSTVREDTMRYARENYDRAKHVKTYIALYKELLAKKEK